MVPIILLILVIIIALGLLWLITKKPAEKPARYFMATNTQRVIRADDTLASLQAQLTQCQNTNKELAAEETALSTAVETLKSSVETLGSPEEFEKTSSLVKKYLTETTPDIMGVIEKLGARLESGLRFYPGIGTQPWYSIMIGIEAHLQDANPLIEQALYLIIDLTNSIDFTAPKNSIQLLELFKSYLNDQIQLLNQLIADISSHLNDTKDLFNQLPGNLGTVDDIIDLREQWENKEGTISESLAEIQGLVEYINTLDQSL